MSKKFITYLLVAVLLGAVLTACERPASTAPATTPAGGEIPFPVQQPTGSLGTLGTQTAIAKNPQVATATGPAGAKTTVPTAQATKAPGVATATPAQLIVEPVVQPTQEIVVPTATPGRPSSYTVQAGDHYICLARRYNVNLSEFLSLNGLSMSSQAVAGKSVKIPQDGSWSTANGNRSLKAHPDTYTVLSGDTLNKIACGYGDVDPNAIIAANGLQSPYTLSAGQTLKIP